MSNPPGDHHAIQININLFVLYFVGASLCYVVVSRFQKAPMGFVIGRILQES